MDGKRVVWNGLMAYRAFGAFSLLHSASAGFLGTEIKHKLIYNAIRIHAFENKALEGAENEIPGGKLGTNCNRKKTFECNMNKLHTKDGVHVCPQGVTTAFFKSSWQTGHLKMNL